MPRNLRIALIPSPGIRDLAIILLPRLRFFARAHQRKACARHHRNIRAPHNFQQAQRVRHFLVAPLIATYDGDSERFHSG